MEHGLMYHGGYERNFRQLRPGATSIVGTDGQEHPLPEWPAEVDGIRVGYMERAGKKFVAVRVTDDVADVVLDNPVLLDPPKHMGHGKRFSAEPTLIGDEVARALMRDIITMNPMQKAELVAIGTRNLDRKK